MAAGSGFGAVTGTNVQADILNHLTPLTTPVAPAVTITGPVKMALCATAGATYTGVDSTNTTFGTECTDANYARQSITAWNAPTTTAGNGYNVGVTTKTTGIGLTFGGTGGFAAQQTVHGYGYYSSDATPVYIGYSNLATNINIPANNQLVVASGSGSLGAS